MSAAIGQKKTVYMQDLANVTGTWLTLPCLLHSPEVLFD